MAGYYGGAVDNIIMRVLDVFFAFPGLLLALAMIAALGSSILNLVLTMGVLFAPSMARVTRGPVLSIRQKEFVEAARALGVREAVIVRTHILPNVVAPDHRRRDAAIVGGHPDRGQSGLPRPGYRHRPIRRSAG